MRVWDNSSPVCFLDGNKIVLYKYGCFYIYDITTFSLLKSFLVFPTFKERYLSRLKAVNRLMRLGIRCAIPLSKSSFVFFLQGKVYEFDIDTGKLSNGYMFPLGERPLQFSYIDRINGFRSGIYFGAYLSNIDKKEVGIYFREASTLWKKVFTFESGLINHIHALIPDKYNQCVWIFTGDFNQAAGIWKAKENFSIVEPILLGKQEYRGCVGFPTRNGLIYATDSQFIGNSIRILEKINGTYTSNIFTPLNGSCIYGGQFKDKFLFATSVEGVGVYKNFLHFLLSRKRGPGIKSDKVCLYAGNLENGFKKIYLQEKDSFPFSFQFGAFQFPTGVNESDYIFFKQVAVKEHDLSTIAIKIQDTI